MPPNLDFFQLFSRLGTRRWRQKWKIIRWLLSGTKIFRYYIHLSWMFFIRKWTLHISKIDPFFVYSFQIQVAPGADVLTVSVWDKNSFSSDEFMGCGYVIIDNCLEGQVNRRVSYILPKNSSFYGKTCLVWFHNFLGLYETVWYLSRWQVYTYPEENWLERVTLGFML